MPTNARRRHRIGTGGPWGTGLLLAGGAVTAQGVGYGTGHPRPPASLMILPSWVWGCLWIAAGLWSIWQALTPPQRHLDVLPIVGVFSLWSAAYFWQWLVTGVTRHDWADGWVSAIGWGMAAGLVICWGGRCTNPPSGIDA